MSKHPTLVAEKRTIKGKKVNALRREGKLPANVYGKKQESISIQVDTSEFEKVYAHSGETGLIELTVGKDTKPVLVKNLQLKYPLRTPLHVDFYQVNLKEKVKGMIPIEITGEAKAVNENIGTLLTPISEVEVEALPADLPEKIEVDVTDLAELDAHILVSDLKVSGDVKILTEPETIVAKIAELAKEEPVEAPAESEETGEETKEQGTGSEGSSEESGESQEEKPAENA